MRPIKLHLEGFSSFANPTDLDFVDVDQFVLFGPTGAGKSSVLDAIAFALYGSVPRYENKALVAPAINQGKAEATVKLDFMVGGTPYTAVRIIKRGVGTKEARLESGGDSLASGPEEVTRQVESILGLDFGQFTKTVLLPQGEFAQFLHDTGRDRNALLKRLLDVQRFESIRRRAEDRWSEAIRTKTNIEGQLEQLEDATEANLRVIRKRIVEIEKVKKEVDKTWPDFEKKTSETTALEENAREIQRQILALFVVKKPEGLDELAERIKQCKEAEERSRSELEVANENCADAQSKLDALPKQSDLERLKDQHKLRSDLTAELERTEPIFQSAVSALADAEGELQSLRLTLTAASAALEQAKNRHLAHAIALTLKSGDPCPVCGAAFHSSPIESPLELSAAQSAEAAANTEVQKGERKRNTTAEQKTTIATRFQTLQERLQEVVGGLKDKKAIQLVELDLKSVAAADKSLRDANQLLSEALVAFKESKDALAGASGAETKARSRLSETREKLLPLSPPALPDSDLSKAWELLESWAVETSKKKEEERLAVQAAASNAREAAESVKNGIRELLMDNGIDHPDLAPPLAVERELAKQEQSLQELDKRVQTAAELKSNLKEVCKRAKLFASLRTHLNAAHFETWYLNRTFRALTDIASVHFKRLTGERYTLSVTKDNDFQIVDHLNAGEERPVRTLSGGETFLASLSLALALSDQISGARSKLESLFIDEGFGSLDPETLETVSSAITELGANGRMIGVITHVQALADSIPVRFTVSKGPSGSEVKVGLS